MFLVFSSCPNIFLSMLQNFPDKNCTVSKSWIYNTNGEMTNLKLCQLQAMRYRNWGLSLFCKKDLFVYSANSSIDLVGILVWSCLYVRSPYVVKIYLAINRISGEYLSLLLPEWFNLFTLPMSQSQHWRIYMGVLIIVSLFHIFLPSSARSIKAHSCNQSAFLQSTQPVQALEVLKFRPWFSLL